MIADTRTMWAVGPDGEAGWQAISAATEDQAITAYCNEHDCEPDFIIAIRVPAWDTLAKVRPVDWFNSNCGLSYGCKDCDTQTSAELDGQIIEGDIYCEFCAAEKKKSDDLAALREGGEG